MIARLIALACLALAVSPADAWGAQAAFDLVGPSLSVQVTRGGRSLPIDAVPNLSAGDKVVVRAVAVPDAPRFLLVSAFLRGATNPPPKTWFKRAESWEKKRGALSLTVPEGARQLVLFVLPETGGGYDAIVDAVRKQPGAFVRASQELYQATLDRARLDRFVALLRAQERADPTRIEALSPVLTRSLAVKLKGECLALNASFQAACMTDSRDSLLFADNHSSTLAETLTGAPADLAFQLSATPEAGFGFYSPYIAVVRDFARLLGAFRSTQFGYIPALSAMAGDRLTLLLNAPPSFANPKSVMVVAMPMIEPEEPPPLRRAPADDPHEPICLASPDAVFRIEGAPLVYATRYAHDVVLRIKGRGGRIDLPLRADPARGGYVPNGPGVEFAGLMSGPVEARLRGAWGFLRFDGPNYPVALPHAPDATSCTPPPAGPPVQVIAAPPYAASLN